MKSIFTKLFLLVIMINCNQTLHSQNESSNKVDNSRFQINTPQNQQVKAIPAGGIDMNTQLGNQQVNTDKPQEEQQQEEQQSEKKAVSKQKTYSSGASGSYVHIKKKKKRIRIRMTGLKKYIAERSIFRKRNIRRNSRKRKYFKCFKF